MRNSGAARFSSHPGRRGDAGRAAPRSRARRALIPFLAVLLAACPALCQDDLSGFLEVHAKADRLARGKEWAGAAGAYRAYAAERPGDTGAPLASVLQGIILARELNKPEEARAAFQAAAKAPDTVFGNEMRQIAMRWVARIQMAAIDAALRKYYVEKVEYPEKLDELAQRKLIKPEALTDPWGKTFSYFTRSLKIARDVPRQAYTLRSTSLEDKGGAFADLLKSSSAFQKKWELKAVSPGATPRAVLAPGGDLSKSFGVSQGGKINSARLIKLSGNAAVIVDGELVAVLTL